MKITKFLMILVLALASWTPITAPAVAGSVTIKNCKSTSVFFKAFDSTDGFRLIAASEGCVKPGQSLTLRCATGTCTMTANWHKCETFEPKPIGKFSGNNVWAGTCIRNGDPAGCMKPGSTCP